MARKITINGRDIGFGSKRFKVDRLVNPDGTYNVRKLGVGLKSFSLYYYLINIPWWLFAILIVISYLFTNMIFALIYHWVGIAYLTGFEGNSTFLEEFLHCFYFSAQTLTTVGYGKISPEGPLTSFIAALEAMVGLIGFAFATGIFYGRFSKARAKIKFSKKAVVSPYRGITGLKFRIVNLRKNHLIDMEARFIYSYLIKEKGELKRKYTNLNLEINFISMFAVPWTIVHPIDETSPLHKKTLEALKEQEAEFIVILKGYDDTFNQYVHQVYDYRYDEVEFDSDFEIMFNPAAEGMTEVYVDKISETKPV